MIDTQKNREYIDHVVNDIFSRVREMIAQGLEVELAFRLAISWELEVSTFRNYSQFLEEKYRETEQNKSDLLSKFNDQFRKKYPRDPNTN